MLPIGRRDATRFFLLCIGGTVAACKRENPDAPPAPECADTSRLSPAELEMRAEVTRYSATSNDPSRNCSTCQLYKPPASSDCGGCIVLRGPVSPAGVCRLWAAKT